MGCTAGRTAPAAQPAAQLHWGRREQRSACQGRTSHYYVALYVCLDENQIIILGSSAHRCRLPISDCTASCTACCAAQLSCREEAAQTRRRCKSGAAAVCGAGSAARVALSALSALSGTRN